MPTNIPTGKFRVQNKVGEEAKVIGDFGTPEEAFSQAQAQNSVLGVEEGSLSPPCSSSTPPASLFTVPPTTDVSIVHPASNSARGF
jgi:hypothetical protein